MKPVKGTHISQPVAAFGMQISVKCLAFISVCLSLVAKAENRNWTEQATGKVISASITERSKAGDKVKLVLSNNTAVWIEASRLIKEDQEYITNWVPAAPVTDASVGEKKPLILNEEKFPIQNLTLAFNQKNSREIRIPLRLSGKRDVKITIEVDRYRYTDLPKRGISCKLVDANGKKYGEQVDIYRSNGIIVTIKDITSISPVLVIEDKNSTLFSDGKEYEFSVSVTPVN